MIVVAETLECELLIQMARLGKSARTHPYRSLLMRQVTKLLFLQRELAARNTPRHP